MVVQKYVDKPLLIEDKKFDLRLYMVMKGIKSIDVYLCEEGMARFATKDYAPPAPDNINNLFMHITNATLNKASEDYLLN